MDAALGEGKPACGDAAIERREVSGRHIERGAVRLLIAHQSATRLIRHVQPLVQIECDGVGLLETGDQRAQIGHQCRERAERAVNVEPQSLIARDLCEGAQVVGSAGVDGARVPDDADRPATLGLVRGESLA